MYLQQLSNVAPVHTHRGHFGATMFMEFVATRLAAESVQKELLANIAERELQIRLANLKVTWRCGFIYLAANAREAQQALKVLGHLQNYASSTERDLKPPPAALPRLKRSSLYSSPFGIFYCFKGKK